MSPAEQIAEKFTERGLDFSHYVNLHLLRGFVFSTPEFFVMGRPVSSFAPHAQVRDPEWLFHRDLVDAWWIHGLAGNVEKTWAILPFNLPRIGFERFDEDLRFYSIATLKRLTIPHEHMARNFV